MKKILLFLMIAFFVFGMTANIFAQEDESFYLDEELMEAVASMGTWYSSFLDNMTGEVIEGTEFENVFNSDGTYQSFFEGEVIEEGYWEIYYDSEYEANYFYLILEDGEFSFHVEFYMEILDEGFSLYSISYYDSDEVYYEYTEEDAVWVKYVFDPEYLDDYDNAEEPNEATNPPVPPRPPRP